MRTVRLGSSGPEVSAQGMSCKALSEYYGTSDEDDAVATITHALDLGVTLLDTADAYALGGNEEMVGRAIRGRREQVVVATKVGGVTEADDTITRSYRADPEYIRHACEASLRRLGVDVIDLYYLHRIDARVPIEESVAAMAELVGAGKVRHLGLTEVSAPELHRASTVHPIAAVQGDWSLWQRRMEDEVVHACRDLGVGVVASAPVGRGFGSGYLVDAPVEHDIHPHKAADTASVQRTLAVLDRIASAHRATRAQVALAWVHQRSEAFGVPVVPIPLHKRRRWVDQSIAAVDLHLSETDLAILDECVSHAPQPSPGVR